MSWSQGGGASHISDADCERSEAMQDAIAGETTKLVPPISQFGWEGGTCLSEARQAPRNYITYFDQIKKVMAWYPAYSEKYVYMNMKYQR